MNKTSFYRVLWSFPQRNRDIRLNPTLAKILVMTKSTKWFSNGNKALKTTISDWIASGWILWPITPQDREI